MKKIGRYIVRSLIGQGGMGKVFKVMMPVTGKIAALKLLKPNPLTVKLMGLESLREMFISEAVIMANLRHPNLLEVWDSDEDEQGNPFYIMDYYCNNLGQMIGETDEMEKPSRIVRTDRAIHYLYQTLLGLACLHHAGIIHRDIKPANLLVTEQDTVKICDFGLSILRGGKFRGPGNLKVGTPYYAPPEQEKKPDEVDFSADLFAAGVTFYRMLTGRLPVNQAENPSRLNPDMDEDWDAFIFKAMHPNPQQRFSGAKKMLATLEALRDSWEKRKQSICHFPFPENNPPSDLSYRIQLRHQPVKVRSESAGTRFSLDELWRPLEYIPNRFRMIGEKEEETVSDGSTGLLWQQSGSEYPLSWQKAKDYVTNLNRQNFSGYDNWRLPTVEELMSLLTETPHGQELCIASLFDETQKWLWSCDRCSHITAWYVSLDLGFVSMQDFSAFYYARAVRNI